MQSAELEQSESRTQIRTVEKFKFKSSRHISQIFLLFKTTWRSMKKKEEEERGEADQQVQSAESEQSEPKNPNMRVTQ